MTKYRIIHQKSGVSPEYTYSTKKWWGWKPSREWYNSSEEIEKVLTKRHFMKGEHKVVKEVIYE